MAGTPVEVGAGGEAGGADEGEDEVGVEVLDGLQTNPTNLLYRIIVMYLHIFQAHPELPRLPTQGFEAEDNVLSRMI